MDNDLVYSTGQGRMCPDCSQPFAKCVCRRQKNVPQGDGTVRVSLETKARKGKGVTCISGVPQDSDGLQDLARQLKQKCGSGGTVKDGIIEIQGDHRPQLIDELRKLGYRVKG
jgi:translation initiation factor 1